MKKKKFKFNVNLTIQELSSIPYLNGVTIFCKARLINGGEFTGSTPRSNVNNHCVRWASKFFFPCKLSSSLASGILETCLCRVSVRKEVKGGKSHEKLGYVDINLAEYAGCGCVTRRYILEGYSENKKHRQDNSILKVTAEMTLTSGDPLFKPQLLPQDQLLSGSLDMPRSSDSSMMTGTYRKLDDKDEFRRSHSDSFSNIPKSSSNQHMRSSSNTSHIKIQTSSHSRNSSVDKRSSGLPGHVTAHSRQSSNISTGDSACADLDTYHLSSPVRSNTRSGDVFRRLDETRVNADDIIDQLINGTDLTADTSRTDEGIDLSLFLDANGVSTMSKVETRKRRELPPIEDRFKTL